MKIAFYVVLLALALALDGLPGSCVQNSTAVRALETQGYSEVTVVEKNVYFITLRGGSKSDAAKFTCRAKNPAGKWVTVYVYSGWPFKGSTVRTD